VFSVFGVPSNAPLFPRVPSFGPAFLRPNSSISSTPPADHADYIARWLKCLKADNRAVFKSAAQASRAVAFVQSMSVSP